MDNEQPTFSRAEIQVIRQLGGDLFDADTLTINNRAFIKIRRAQARYGETTDTRYIADSLTGQHSAFERGNSLLPVILAVVTSQIRQVERTLENLRALQADIRSEFAV